MTDNTSVHWQDNDRYLQGSCAQENKAGWWFNRWDPSNKFYIITVKKKKKYKDTIVSNYLQKMPFYDLFMRTRGWMHFKKVLHIWPCVLSFYLKMPCSKPKWKVPPHREVQGPVWQWCGVGDLERPLVFPSTHHHEGATSGFLGLHGQRSRGNLKALGFRFHCKWRQKMDFMFALFVFWFLPLHHESKLLSNGSIVQNLLFSSNNFFL